MSGAPCWSLLGLGGIGGCGHVVLGEWVSLLLSVTSVPAPMATLSMSPWAVAGAAGERG